MDNVDLEPILIISRLFLLCCYNNCVILSILYNYYGSIVIMISNRLTLGLCYYNRYDIIHFINIIHFILLLSLLHYKLL